jgi:hypothetical protein
VAGVRLDRLLWVRCGHNAEHALQAADLLIQGGGFGLVAMDLGDTPPETARRVSLTSWFRLRRAVEHTPAVLLVVARQSNAPTCARLLLECQKGDRPLFRYSIPSLQAALNPEKGSVPFLGARASGAPCWYPYRHGTPNIGKNADVASQRLTPRLNRPRNIGSLLDGIPVYVTRRKPGRAITASFHARARE